MPALDAFPTIGAGRQTYAEFLAHFANGLQSHAISIVTPMRAARFATYVRSRSPTFAHVSMGQATGTCARVSEHTVGGPARYSPGQPQRDAGAQAGEGEGEHQHPPLHHTDAGGRRGGGGAPHMAGGRLRKRQSTGGTFSLQMLNNPFIYNCR